MPNKEAAECEIKSFVKSYAVILPFCVTTSETEIEKKHLSR